MLLDGGFSNMSMELRAPGRKRGRKRGAENGVRPYFRPYFRPLLRAISLPYFAISPVPYFAYSLFVPYFAIVKGCRGVRVEPTIDGRTVNQASGASNSTASSTYPIAIYDKVVLAFAQSDAGSAYLQWH